MAREEARKAKLAAQLSARAACDADVAKAAIDAKLDYERRQAARLQRLTPPLLPYFRLTPPLIL